MLVSVIVPTRNRAHDVEDFLLSFLKMNNPEASYELLIVDNGSTDNTREIVAKFINKNQSINCSYIYAPEPGLHVGRNIGLQKSSGDVLAYCDDDTQLLKPWLSSIFRAFSDPEVSMAGGNNYPLFDQSPPEWFSCLWERKARGTSRMRVFPQYSVLDYRREFATDLSPYLVFGCNFIVRRSVLLESEGFHPDGVPSELELFRGDGETSVSEFVLKSGKRCVFDPGLSVYHKVSKHRLSKEYMAKRGRLQGISDSFTDHRNLSGRALAAKKLRRRVVSSSKVAYLKHRDGTKPLSDYYNSYLQGYKLHDEAYYENCRLREWVHRQNYLGENSLIPKEP